MVNNEGGVLVPAASGGPIRVFLLDDHEIVRRGVRDLVEMQDDITVVGEAATAAEAGPATAGIGATTYACRVR